MKNILEEYKDFISKGNILPIAVALVMALYFQAIIQALLDGVIYPIIAAVFGEPTLGNIGFDLGASFVSIGLVIDAVLMFLIVGFVLFLIIKGWNAVDEPDEDDAGPTEIELLTEIRDSLRSR